MDLKNMAIHMLDIQHDPTLKWVSGHWSNFGGKAIPISPPVSVNMDLMGRFARSRVRADFGGMEEHDLDGVDRAKLCKYENRILQ